MEPGEVPHADDPCDYFYSMYIDRRFFSFTDCTAEEDAMLLRLPGTPPPPPKIMEKYKPGTSRVRKMLLCFQRQDMVCDRFDYKLPTLRSVTHAVQ